MFRPWRLATPFMCEILNCLPASPQKFSSTSLSSRLWLRWSKRNRLWRGLKPPLGRKGSRGRRGEAKAAAGPEVIKEKKVEGEAGAAPVAAAAPKEKEQKK